MKKYILALDEGTTSTRSILFDQKGRIISSAQKEFTQHYPASGWVEHDAMEIYASQYATMTEAVVASGIDPAEIAAVGITNQRETTVVWHKETGRPVAPAIVWQCRRTEALCEELKKRRVFRLTLIFPPPSWLGSSIIPKAQEPPLRTENCCSARSIPFSSGN